MAGGGEVRDGLCPHAEHVLPRLVFAGSMREPESARQWAEQMAGAIAAMERG